MTDQKKPVYRIIIATHGSLADGFIDSAQVLLGEQHDLQAFCLLPSQRMESFADLLRKEVEQHGASNILFLTDLMNGTPFNAVVSLVRYYPVIYHITGVNLAVLIGALVARSQGASMEEICDAAVQASGNSILDVRKLLDDLNAEQDE